MLLPTARDRPDPIGDDSVDDILIFVPLPDLKRQPNHGASACDESGGTAVGDAVAPRRPSAALPGGAWRQAVDEPFAEALRGG